MRTWLAQAFALYFILAASVTLFAQKRKGADKTTLKVDLPASAADFAEPWREAYFSGAPLRIGNKVQFLFDDYAVEDRFGLTRVVGRVEKYEGNPLTIGDDMPWETSTTSWAGANLRQVIYDPKDKLYKGWYLIYRREPGIESGYNYSTLYAESKDGVTWTKPELDYYKIGGHKTNYVMHRDDGTFLMQDIRLDTAATDVNKRYMALVKMIPPGEKVRCIVLFYSPDGKKWTMADDPVLFRGASDGSYSLVSDASRNRWLLYRRTPTNALVKEGLGVYGFQPINHTNGMNIKRRLSVTVSSDMKSWSPPRGIGILDELDDASLGILGNNMDIDWATVIKYRDVYFGFLHLMDNLTMAVPRHNQLMWSRDGLRWERLPQRLNFVGNGKPGDWDAGSIGSISVLPRGNRIHIYYSGGNTSQGESRINSFSGTGLAFMDKDRFIGMQAGPEGGYLLTRQFVVEGSKLELNFRSQVENPPPNWGSLLKAEILEGSADQEAARPYPGFAMADCDGITISDSFGKAMTWKGSPDLSALKGKAVYVRFYLQNTTLYTFQIAE